jgi:SMODS and SLOG-associating 2TM effector domain 1
MSDQWQREYLAAYRRHRLDDQTSYYGTRARSFERSRRRIVTLSASFMIAAAFFGALGAADADRRPEWAFTGAVVAAIGTALTSFESAFGLERYARLYDEAHRALALAAADAPQAEDLEGPEGDATLQAFVERVEGILGDEVDSWGFYSRLPGASEAEITASRPPPI